MNRLRHQARVWWAALCTIFGIWFSYEMWGWLGVLTYVVVFVVLLELVVWLLGDGWERTRVWWIVRRIAKDRRA